MPGRIHDARRWLLFWPVIAAILAQPISALCAGKSLNGREIFAKLCVKCHGRNGEGVKGKYDGPLQGDWTIEKLTRVIDKTMPEDDPKKCAGRDAEAVARYIYDAFYSREARARNHPARIELSRLTNRQYLNSIADLLRNFQDPTPALGADRGLKAAYFQSRGFRQDKKGFDRVDREVKYDFVSNGPDGKPIGTNEFSLQWRGSIIADETGDHQFIIKSANGVRFWVNDDDTPIIDASVASGDVNEHRATVRLIGGRAYPLRLDYSKASKDPTAAISLLWKPPHSAEQVIPARNFTPTHVPATFVVTAKFPADDSSVGYERGVAVSKAWDEAATAAAIETATYVAKHIDRLSRTKSGDTNRVARIQNFCVEFVSAAFRRPLTEEQKKLFVALHFQRAAKVDDAVKRVVVLALKSPRFLYLGLDNRRPDEFDVAERLSFGLWDSLPDSQLWKAAGSGALKTAEQIRKQALRMCNDPRAHAKMRTFFHHWLQMDRVDDLSKDAGLFPAFKPDVITDLRTSLDLFLDDVMWSASSNYQDLLLANYLFVNGRLANFYGMSTNSSDDFIRVSMNSNERAGVITHPYLLAAFSYQKSTSPIHRGVFLTRNIVGRSLRPPPMAQTFKDADFSPKMSMREKVEELTRSQACQSCHAVINPLGFSLENFDAVGRFRASENNRPVNAVSDYTTDDGRTVRLSGARDLAQFAASSEQAQKSFIEQLFNQVVKQPMVAYSPNCMDRLRESFVASGFNIRNLLVEIATLSASHGLGHSNGTDSKKP